jgi:hypothetical protein
MYGSQENPQLKKALKQEASVKLQNFVPSYQDTNNPSSS